MKNAVVTILRSFWGQAFAALGMFALLLEIIRLGYRFLTLTSWNDLESTFPGGSAIAAWCSVAIVVLVPSICFHCFCKAPLSRIATGIWCAVAALTWFALDLAWWGDGAEVSSRVKHILSNQLREVMVAERPAPVESPPQQDPPPMREQEPEPGSAYALYSKAVDERQAQQDQFRLAIFNEAITRDPAARAEAITIARALGVSPDAVEGNMDVMKAMHARMMFQARELEKTNPELAMLMDNYEFARIAYGERDEIRSVNPGIRFSAAYRHCAMQREALALASGFLNGLPVDLPRLAFLRSRLLAMSGPEGDLFGASGAFVGQRSATFANPSRAMFAISTMLSGLLLCWTLLVTFRQFSAPVEVASEGAS